MRCVVFGKYALYDSGYGRVTLNFPLASAWTYPTGAGCRDIQMPDLSLHMVETRPNRGASACPGLFRIVPALDGGLCRVRLPLGYLAANQARTVAAASERFGNGIIDATNRANLQLRGIKRGSEPALIDDLLGANLGPANPYVDDVRNVMVSPTAGFDPDQEIDTLPMARTLLSHLQTDNACRALSPKFSVLIDGGERVAAVEHPHDIWLASLDGSAMALGIAGSPPIQDRDRTPFLVVPASRGVESVIFSIALFLDAAARNPDVTRFRHMGSDNTLDRLGDFLGVSVQRDAAWRRAVPAPGGHIGIRMQRQAGLVFVGAMPPLGRLSPRMLVKLADVSEEFGAGDIHLTPWQSVLIPAIPDSMALHVVQTLETLGLICNPHAPLASMIACAGSPGCAASFSDTKADALALARALPVRDRASRVIHLSGCAKSCASARSADVTLVASAPGAYELFRKVEGSNNRFGQSMACNLSIRDVGKKLCNMDPT